MTSYTVTWHINYIKHHHIYDCCLICWYHKTPLQQGIEIIELYQKLNKNGETNPASNDIQYCPHFPLTVTPCSRHTSNYSFSTTHQQHNPFWNSNFSYSFLHSSLLHLEILALQNVNLWNHWFLFMSWLFLQLRACPKNS